MLAALAVMWLRKLNPEQTASSTFRPAESDETGRRVILRRAQLISFFPGELPPIERTQVVQASKETVPSWLVVHVGVSVADTMVSRATA